MLVIKNSARFQQLKDTQEITCTFILPSNCFGFMAALFFIGCRHGTQRAAQGRVVIPSLNGSSQSYNNRPRISPSHISHTGS